MIANLIFIVDICRYNTCTNAVKYKRKPRNMNSKNANYNELQEYIIFKHSKNTTVVEKHKPLISKQHNTYYTNRRNMTYIYILRSLTCPIHFYSPSKNTHQNRAVIKNCITIVNNYN